MGSTRELPHPDVGRVTTDTAHRRLTKNKKRDINNCTQNVEDYFYCVPCKQRIDARAGKGELIFHFNTVQHEPCDTCVYCKKPVYYFRYKKKSEIFHICQHDT